MKNLYYKVTGRFEVYDKYKAMITDQFFVNKIFEAGFPRAALNMALVYAGRRASKKYGKGTTVSQASNLKLAKSHAPIKKNKRKKNKAQGSLF